MIHGYGNFPQWRLPAQRIEVCLNCIGDFVAQLCILRLNLQVQCGANRCRDLRAKVTEVTDH